MGTRDAARRGQLRALCTHDANNVMLCYVMRPRRSPRSPPSALAATQPAICCPRRPLRGVLTQLQPCAAGAAVRTRPPAGLPRHGSPAGGQRRLNDILLEFLGEPECDWGASNPGLLRARGASHRLLARSCRVAGAEPRGHPPEPAARATSARAGRPRRRRRRRAAAAVAVLAATARAATARVATAPAAAALAAAALADAALAAVLAAVTLAAATLVAAARAAALATTAFAAAAVAAAAIAAAAAAAVAAAALAALAAAVRWMGYGRAGSGPRPR